MKLEYWHTMKTLGISLIDVKTGESEAYTIVDVDKSKKNISIQLDDATLKPDFKENIVADGYFICCTNQDEQQYNYVSNPKNPLEFLVSKDGETYKVKDGEADYLVVPGRRKFVDITKNLLSEHTNIKN